MELDKEEKAWQHQLYRARQAKERAEVRQALKDRQKEIERANELEERSGERKRKFDVDACREKRAQAEAQVLLDEKKAQQEQERTLRNSITRTMISNQRGQGWLNANKRSLPDSYFPGVSRPHARCEHGREGFCRKCYVARIARPAPRLTARGLFGPCDLARRLPQPPRLAKSPCPLVVSVCCLLWGFRPSACFLESRRVGF